MPPYGLGGQAALVTGAASGIGYATAAMLGHSGARVLGCAAAMVTGQTLVVDGELTL